MRVVLLWLMLVASAAAQAPQDEFARLATEGWAAARAAAAKGGSPESLAPAARATVALDKTSTGMSMPLHKEYARAVIRAAMAAAQDERGEMEVYLLHARDLSQRLETSTRPARWPLPIDEAEGELWLEVDRYAEAVKAYRRAAARPGATTAFLGLARSAARLGDRRLACDSYRRWLPFAPAGPVSQEAFDYLARCVP